MKPLILASVMVFGSGVGALGAQGPSERRPMPGPGPGAMGPGAPGRGPVDNPAEFLLSQTGELRLTDAQVTRLAAIARRSADRRRALRARMDSLRTSGPRAERPDSAARAQMRRRFEQMRPEMERVRDQSLADRRDAIAVLTPDQQAQAWERIARMGRTGGFAGPRRGGLRNRPAPGGRAERTRGQEMGPQRMGPRRMRPPTER